MKKKTIFNILLIAFVLAFFVTPLGFYGKVFLNKLFASAPEVIVETNRKPLGDYDWKLKDPNWEFFNFEQSKGHVVFINLWASWRLPCVAELQSIQDFYDAYGDKMDFYIITNEERPPVEEFMTKNKFTFPVTYLIIGEKMPIDAEKVPSSYLIDKKGNVVIHKKEGIADWDNDTVYKTVEALLAE